MEDDKSARNKRVLKVSAGALEAGVDSTASALSPHNNNNSNNTNHNTHLSPKEKNKEKLTGLLKERVVTKLSTVNAQLAAPTLSSPAAAGGRGNSDPRDNKAVSAADSKDGDKGGKKERAGEGGSEKKEKGGEKVEKVGESPALAVFERNIALMKPAKVAGKKKDKLTDQQLRVVKLLEGTAKRLTALSVKDSSDLRTALLQETRITE